MGFLKDFAQGFAESGADYYKKEAFSQIEERRAVRMAKVKHGHDTDLKMTDAGIAKNIVESDRLYNKYDQVMADNPNDPDGPQIAIQNTNLGSGEVTGIQGLASTVVTEGGKDRRQTEQIDATVESDIRMKAHSMGLAVLNNSEEMKRARANFTNKLELAEWDAVIAEMNNDSREIQEAMRNDTALEISEDRNASAWRLLQSSNTQELIKLNDVQAHDQWKSGFLQSGMKERLELQLKSDKELKGLDGKQALERLVKKISADSDLSEQQHDQLLDRLSEEFGYSTELKDQDIKGRIKVQDAGYVWQQTLQNERLDAGQKIAEMQDKLSRDMTDKKLSSQEKLQNLLGIQRKDQSTLDAELQKAVNKDSAANKRGDNDAQFQQTRTLLQMNQAFSAGETQAKQAFTLSRDAQQAEEQLMKMYANFDMQGGRDVIKTVQVEKQDEFGSTYMVPMSIKESPEGDVTKIWFDNKWVDPAIPKDLKPATEPAIAKARGLLKKAQDDIEGATTSDFRDYRALGTTKEAYAERFLKDALKDAGYTYTVKQRPPKTMAEGVTQIKRRNPDLTDAEAEERMRELFPDLE